MCAISIILFNLLLLYLRQNIEFLDIKLSACRNRLSTSVHYKTTDSHSYLKYGSWNPKACKNAIPYSRFLRLRRLCSEDNDIVSTHNSHSKAIKHIAQKNFHMLKS